MIFSSTTKIEEHIEINCSDDSVNTSLIKSYDKGGVVVFDFEVNNHNKKFLQPITLSWKIPAINVKGIWKPTADFSKRIQADWELDHMESRISIDAPVINLFGHDDSNVLTFACSNVINKIEMNSRIREEDNHFYCYITFFSELEEPLSNFKAQILLDYRNLHFSECLKEVSKWWETFENLAPASVPQIAKEPLYSTWYQFHQNLEEDVLLKECEIAYDMGYKSIILDDGWQTKDSNRGYDYTGDWQPDRIPNMSNFVGKVHEIGMKVALWYSVPFCGKKSNAYKKFKGKFLTENHRWAPVFDPRYPEVREYLIGIYKNALHEWNLDGFKLDFIDDFHQYEDTPLGKENGRDYASINEAVDCLMSDVLKTLQSINPEIFIEFRQKYTGPAMRKYGNMFRAFDCPGDSTMNRVRIADIRMLSGNTAVHADMVTWHPEEPVEIAALQLINTFFGVPQLSVMLQNTPSSHLKMISFYTKYWNEYADVLMNGNFVPYKPLANYPLQIVSTERYTIIGVHDEFVLPLEKVTSNIHIFNAQIANEIILKCSEDFGIYKALVHDCQGNIVSDSSIDLSEGLVMIKVPVCGIVLLEELGNG